MHIVKYQTTWNLKPLYTKKHIDIEKEMNLLKKETSKFVSKWKKNTNYLRSPKKLKTALDEYESWAKNFGISGKIGYYIGLRYHLNQNDPKLKGYINKISELENQIINSIQFFELNLAKIDIENQKVFLKSPLLKDYKHFLEKLFLESKHLLSEKEEKILTLKSKVAHSNWTAMTSEFLSKEERKVLTESGKKEVKNKSEIESLLSNRKKKVRDSAVLAYQDIINKFHEVATYEINSILENKKINDKLRKFERPDQSRHLSDDIDSKVVDELIKTVSNNYKISKRYYKLKAKLLNLEKLDYHERNLQYGDIEIKYEYDKAIKLVSNVFKNLDSEFYEILNNFIENGQIDVYPKKGKRSGAFCTHDSLINPTYILLNHTNKLNDVLTIAHECGHGINNELIRKKQNELNFATPTSTAEVASTFMEDFVLQTLMNKSDEETRLSLMMEKLNADISTIFRQVACYKFEYNLHTKYREKGYLSKDEIDKLFQNEMKNYMGTYVRQNYASEKFWVIWPHIRSFFYVYSYTSGLLISKSLQNKVKQDKSFIIKVKKFLSAGTSKSPKDIFLDLGIDISKREFWESGIKEVDILLSETEQLAKKLGKI